jgi:hypothetical protein
VREVREMHAQLAQKIFSPRGGMLGKRELHMTRDLPQPLDMGKKPRAHYVVFQGRPPVQRERRLTHARDFLDAGR